MSAEKMFIRRKLKQYIYDIENKSKIKDYNYKVSELWKKSQSNGNQNSYIYIELIKK